MPFVLVPELTDRQLERYHRHVDSDASGWHRKWTESIWRRHQHPSNARLSGWTGDGDKKRRLIHFYDEYGVDGRAFVLRGTYLWLNLLLPESDIEAYHSTIHAGLTKGGWTRDGQAHVRGDLTATIEAHRWHPRDEERGYLYPRGYADLDVRIQSRGYRVPDGWDVRPWKVFFDVGLRKVLPRQTPRVVEPEALAEHLPAQLELGCGPSIEAGVPHLSTLHRIYGVSRGDYSFVYRAEDDGLLSFFADPEGKLREMTDIYRACILAETTPFYQSILELTRTGAIVGPVITNNFDCLCADLGLPEVSLRRYDWQPYYPTIEHDPRARSLLVVGVHADRRLVQMRARDRGLKVLFVDPEAYIAPDGKRIPYPVEAPQADDLFVRATASEALTRLRDHLGGAVHHGRSA